MLNQKIKRIEHPPICNTYIHSMQPIYSYYTPRSITRDTIPEECLNSTNNRRPSWLPPPPRETPRPSVRRQQTVGSALLVSSSSSQSDSSDEDGAENRLIQP
ncbi:hypothetical protein QE152_g3436 [Popillia japonica]|uniref:Uncharacterized protein n=1 Tax=Popillia japonica TaxID=7064 RepID=A0AAW1N271_POPJA